MLIFPKLLKREKLGFLITKLGSQENGIYDNVIEILKENEKEIIEDGGVMPNSTVEKRLFHSEIRFHIAITRVM